MACGIWDGVRICAAWAMQFPLADSRNRTALGAQQDPHWGTAIKLGDCNHIGFSERSDGMLYLLHLQSECQWNIRGDREQDFMWLPGLVCRAHPA